MHQNQQQEIHSPHIKIETSPSLGPDETPSAPPAAKSLISGPQAQDNNMKIRSAPSTPLRSASSRVHPSSNQPSELRLSANASPAQSISSPSSQLSNPLASPESASPIPKFSAYYFGICSKKVSKQIAPFVALFSWQKDKVPESEACWGNDYKNILLEPNQSLLVVFRVRFLSFSRTHLPLPTPPFPTSYLKIPLFFIFRICRSIPSTRKRRKLIPGFAECCIMAKQVSILPKSRK